MGVLLTRMEGVIYNVQIRKKDNDGCILLNKEIIHELGIDVGLKKEDLCEK